MLDTTYIMLRGCYLQNPEVNMTKEVLMQYITLFDDATTKTVDTGEIQAEYCYYFEQLEAFSKIYPQYDITKLERKYSDILSTFYYKPHFKRNAYNRNR